MKLKIKEKTVSAKGLVVHPGQEIPADPEHWPPHRITRLAAVGHLEVVQEAGEEGAAEVQTMDQPTGVERMVGQVGAVLGRRKKR